VGIVAFGAVVVLTMLASLSFDPRLIWDPVSTADKLQTSTPFTTHNEIAQERTP
jgi:paraquat-inducible protein A